MSSPLTWDQALSTYEQPIPKFIRDMHRVRVIDNHFFRAADYDSTNDWTQTLTGTGTIARALGAAATQGPTLKLSTAAANDGAVTVHNAKFIQMPHTGEGSIFYLAFDWLANNNTNQDRAFGIFSGTPAQFFDPTTRAVMSAGAGICFRHTSATNALELWYKTAAGAATLLASLSSAFVATTTNFRRLGFLVMVDQNASASNDLALGRVIPFSRSLLNVTGFSTPGGSDDFADFPSVAFLPTPGGISLDRATWDDASATGCGIALGAAGTGASARDLSVRRILYVDNLRR